MLAFINVLVIHFGLRFLVLRYTAPAVGLVTTASRIG